MIEVPLSYDGARRPNPSLEWYRSPARPALQVASALDRVRRASAILPATRLLPDVLHAVDEAVRQGIAAQSVLAPLLEAVADVRDTVTGLAAVHALARVPGPEAQTELARLLLASSPGFAEHAAWSLSHRPASSWLAAPLAASVARGGVLGMHAQQALARWAERDPDVVVAALADVLGETVASDERRYLTETVGLVPGARASRLLTRVGSDPDEAAEVRNTAVGAFTERLDERLPALFTRPGRLDGELVEALRAVRAQRRLIRRGPRLADQRHQGLRVAHIHLGEAGGLATLLPQLGRHLSDRPRVAETITVLRANETAEPLTSIDSGHRLERVRLEPGEGATFASRWPSLVAARRGIRAAFLAGYRPDVVHLRMADPGSLAGAMVARELGVPMVFTLAADPHSHVVAAESAGRLDRRSFAAEDARGALWLRTSLVGRLAAEARELAVFPRPDVRGQLKDLTGIAIDAGRPRSVVVAEGVDTARADEASATLEKAREMPPVIGDLQQAVSRLPAERRGLPLVTSVGRLHEAKGMARLVEAFAVDAELAARANLVIVGGNLRHPSAAEAGELTRIRHLFDRYPGLQDRVVLLGHRSHEEVALVLAATRAGWGSLIAPAGAYACASAKEEFGLAIVEAMAAGLPVTAPLRGGPSTYVTVGLDGYLADTLQSPEIATSVRATLDLAADPETARRTRAAVEKRYTVERMARTLSAVYRVTAGASTLALPVSVEAVAP